MPYNVYTAKFFGIPHNHVIIFVQTSSDAGYRYHVFGTVAVGMNYEMRSEQLPEAAGDFVEGSKVFVGTMDESDLGRIDTICETVPPPSKQVRLNGQRIDPSKPVYRCSDWVEDAVAKLVEEGVLRR